MFQTACENPYVCLVILASMLSFLARYRITNRHNKLSLVLGANVKQGRPNIVANASVALLAQSHEVQSNLTLSQTS
jgi:hypothetical protein